MQINAINSPITKAPSFASKSYEDAESYYKDVDAIVAIVDSEKNGNGEDTVELSKSSNDVKNAVETGVAILGAVLIPFITGKALVMGANKMFPEITGKAAKTVTGAGKTVKGLVLDGFNGVGKKLQEGGKPKKALNFVKNGARTVYRSVFKEDKIQTLSNVAGITAAGVTIPTLINADSNGDGIKDIKQKSVSAYESVTKNMGVAKTLMDIVM